MKIRKIQFKKNGVHLILLFCILIFLFSNVQAANFIELTVEHITNVEVSNLGRDGDVLWDNGDPGNMLIASQWDSIIPFNAQTADDFMFDTDTEIFGIGWYGGFWNGPPVDICDFTIYLYSDDGTGNAPTGGGTDNPEVTALETFFVEDVVGEPIIEYSYYYEVVLETPFVAQQDVKYWLVIQCVLNYPPQWGWYETYTSIQLSHAVQGFPGHDDCPYWTETEYNDQSFYLFGEGEPSEQTELEIQSINGGFGVNVVVSNVGDVEAEDVEIFVNISGGLFGLVDESMYVPPFSLEVGSDETVDSDMFFGLGPIEVEVVAQADTADRISVTRDGFILGVFVLLNN